MSGYYTRSFPVERSPGGVGSLGSVYQGIAVAPHGSTVRWTYTVPSGKAAHLEGYAGTILRNTAAAPVGLVQCQLYAGASYFLFDLQQIDNTVGGRSNATAGEAGYLKAGEALNALTIDQSTGGTNTYTIACRYREFLV